jgi:hypothetical protein
VSVTNSLAEHFPEIAKQLDADRNGGNHRREDRRRIAEEVLVALS